MWGHSKEFFKLKSWITAWSCWAPRTSDPESNKRAKVIDQIPCEELEWLLHNVGSKECVWNLKDTQGTSSCHYDQDRNERAIVATTT